MPSCNFLVVHPSGRQGDCRLPHRFLEDDRRRDPTCHVADESCAHPAMRLAHDYSRRGRFSRGDVQALSSYGPRQSNGGESIQELHQLSFFVHAMLDCTTTPMDS